MSTDNNIKNFTAADIEKYHRGLLSSKERHDLEKAALDDPFLAEALEGYAVTGINSGADIAELKKKLHERVESAKVIPLDGGDHHRFPWLRVAVMIVVLAGAGLLVYQFAFNKKQAGTIAQAETKKTDAIKSTDTGTLTAPATTDKESGTAFTTPAEEKKEQPGSLKVQKLTVETTKDANGSGLTKIDSTPGNYYTTIDKPAAPIVNTSPKSLDEKNNPSVVPERNADKKEIARLDVKNKTNNRDKQEIDKDGMKDASGQEAEDLKKNKGYVATRKSDDQFYRNNVTNTFRGRVTDASNVGVPFARITNAQDNNAGTYTDAQGNFNLTSPDTVLNVQVKSVGFENNNVQLRNNVSNNQVVLQDDRSLSDVVISNQKSNTLARSRDANMKLEEPEPADGWENYDTYLTNNLNVPEDFKPKQVNNASVEISFEVDKNGEPVNIKIEKSLCLQCDKEAIRLVKEGPKWKRHAKKGRTTVTIPFNNALQ